MKLEHFNICGRLWLICKMQTMLDGDQVLKKILCQIKHTLKTEINRAIPLLIPRSTK